MLDELEHLRQLVATGKEKLDRQLLAKGTRRVGRWREDKGIEGPSSLFGDAVQLARGLGLFQYVLDQTVHGQAVDGPVDFPEVELPEVTEYPLALALQRIAMDSIWVPGNRTEQGIPDSASMVHGQFPPSRSPIPSSEAKQYALTRDGFARPPADCQELGITQHSGTEYLWNVLRNGAGVGRHQPPDRRRGTRRASRTRLIRGRRPEASSSEPLRRLLSATLADQRPIRSRS